MKTKFCAIAALAALTTLATPAPASVVMNGTRIIYPAGQVSKTLQLTNEDAHPNLVQVWVEGDGRHDTDTAAPFIVSPPIFRMEPHTGQMLRLRFAGSEDAATAFPTDRESVFYLNFTQVPALPEDGLDANRLVLLFQSRIKLFYRPQGLPAHEHSCDTLALYRDGDRVVVENPSAYHVVVSRADLLAGQDSRVTLAESQMIAPFSQARWALPAAAAENTPAPAQLDLMLRNDYGTDASHVCALR